MGRTQTLKRCRNEAQFLVCRHHTYQPAAWILFGLTMVGLVAGLFQDIVSPYFHRRDLPFPSRTEEQIHYYEYSGEDSSSTTFPGAPRGAPELSAECRHQLKAGSRWGIDAFVVCLGDVGEPWLELYRPSASFHGKYPNMGDAAYQQLFDGYESAIVGTSQVGSGGFLTVTVLIWQNDRYVELTHWAGADDIHYATAGFTDLDDDGWKELVVREGKWPHEQEHWVFGFDRSRLEYFEWPDDSASRERASQRISEACDRNEEFAVLCEDPSPN